MLSNYSIFSEEVTSPSSHGVFSVLVPSRWSLSLGKRCFDVLCALLSLPFVLPVLFVAGLAVRLTSRGPVLFRQQRIGRNGKPFTIFKFRTMPVVRGPQGRPRVTTVINQRFTPVGPFLRRWKLDELPQVFNVLRGDMSLVGPRPKLPSHQTSPIACRPGITGRATFVFAREEAALARIPGSQLDSYYREVVLPLKHELDDEYMARATFASDFDLIVRSVLRKWDTRELEEILSARPPLMPSLRRSNLPLHKIDLASLELTSAD